MKKYKTCIKGKALLWSGLGLSMWFRWASPVLAPVNTTSCLLPQCPVSLPSILQHRLSPESCPPHLLHQAYLRTPQNFCFIYDTLSFNKLFLYLTRRSLWAGLVSFYLCCNLAVCLAYTQWVFAELISERMNDLTELSVCPRAGPTFKNFGPWKTTHILSLGVLIPCGSSHSFF